MSRTFPTSRGDDAVDDRRVLNGIFWVLRSGAPWGDLPERYGPRTTVYNRFNQWRKAGVSDHLMDAIVSAHDGDVQMIDTSVVRVRQQGATARGRDHKHSTCRVTPANSKCRFAARLISLT